MRRKRPQIPITIGKSIQVVDDIRYIKINGNVIWKFISTYIHDSQVDVTMDCENWYMITNKEWIIFWSPDGDWIPCLKKQELKVDKYNWRLMSNKLHVNDPEGVALAILDDFMEYYLNSDTIPIIDNSFVENKIYSLINYIIQINN